MKVNNKPANREEAIRIRAAILDGKKMGQRFSYVTSKSKRVATKMIDNETKNPTRDASSRVKKAS